MGVQSHEFVERLDAPAAVGTGMFGGMGTAPHLVGKGLDQDGAHDVLDRAVVLGAHIIDTAVSYAEGAAQRMLGSWLAAAPGRREQVAIVDKIGGMTSDDRVWLDLSPDNVRAQAALGRERMGVDHVDVLLFHAPDPETDPVDSAAAFADELDAGHALGWGMSNVSMEETMSWLDAADQIGLPTPVYIENGYNLLQRGDEAELLPLCGQRGIGYLAYGPLAGGVLTGKYLPERPSPTDARSKYRPDFTAGLDEDVHRAVRGLVELADQLQVPATSLALAWVMAQPGVTPIVGVRRTEQLDDQERAFGLGLSNEHIEALGSLFPVK